MKSEIIQSLHFAQTHFKKWRLKSFEERQSYLFALEKILLTEKENLGLLITQDMNKPISQSIAEIEKCAGLCRYYAEIDNPLSAELVETSWSISEIHHEPLGVILGVMPWNYPFWQVLRFAIPTLLAGNSVVIKHASNCLNSGDAIEKMMVDAGFPLGLFQHLHLNHKEVEELIAQPEIRAISLTGSDAAGRKIGEIAGKNLKKCVLELGGNDAFIVLADADLVKAAKAAALARLQNCGQTCVAGKRFIIHQDVYTEFITLFIAEYIKYQPENPMSQETILGYMSREDLAADLVTQYEKAIANGAEIIVPLKVLSPIALQPGLLKMNVGNPVLDEELFGPLGMVLVVASDEEALQVANATSFGLANAVFTQNKDKAMYFAHHLESGSVAINQLFKSDVRLPFSGRKNSGYGTELSQYALKEFTTTKTIVGEV
jgi:succinate-semialdehyde dehydrogenase/glutarate-semialdehyde dehydrogenase